MIAIFDKILGKFRQSDASELPVTVLGTSGTVTLNRSISDKFTLTPTGAVTLATSGFNDLQEAILKITNSYDFVSFPASWIWQTVLPSQTDQNLIKIKQVGSNIFAWSLGHNTNWSAGAGTIGLLNKYLKHVWKLSDTSDSKGTATLTNSGATFAEGKNGNAAVLNTAGYLKNSDATDVISGTQDFTFSAWVYPTSYGSPSALLIEENTGSDWLQLYYNATDVVLAGSMLTTITGAGAIALDSWSNIILARSGNTFSIHVNGVSITSSTQDITVPEMTKVTLGGNASADQAVRGKLDETYLWVGHGMDATEITALYNDGTGSFYK